MYLKEIGACLLILVAAVAAGNLWFHFVDGILERVKRLFTRHKAPPAWHPLPPEQEDEGDV